MPDSKKAPNITLEEYQKRLEALKNNRDELAKQINAHKDKAIQHREQLKLFIRQGVETLPPKQQEEHETLQENEQHLQEKLTALQTEAEVLKKLKESITQ